MPRKSRPASSRKNAHHRVKAFVAPERAPNDMGYRATIKGLGVCAASDYPDFGIFDIKKHRVVVELAKCQTDADESCWVLFLLQISSEVRPSRQPPLLTLAPPVTQRIAAFPFTDRDSIETKMKLFNGNRKFLIEHLPHLKKDRFVWQVNLDDNDINGIRTSGKFFRDLMGVFKQLGRNQLNYVNLTRPSAAPSGSLIGVRTMSTRNRDCHKAKELTAMTMQEHSEADAEKEGAWTFSGNLATPYFQQLVKIYRYGLEQPAHVDPSLPEARSQNQTKNQTKKQNKKNRAKAKKGGKGLSQKAVEQEMEKWEEKMKRSTNGQG